MSIPAHIANSVAFQASEWLRQQEIISWELTYVQILSLPVTTDCPAEELL